MNKEEHKKSIVEKNMSFLIMFLRPKPLLCELQHTRWLHVDVHLHRLGRGGGSALPCGGVLGRR